MDSVARPFNPFWRAHSDAMRKTVAELRQQLEGYEKFYQLRQRKRRAADQETFDRTVEAVICDLVHRELTCPGGKVHVSQSNQVLRKKSRYKGQAYNKNLPEWLQNMIAPEMNFLTYELGKRVVVIADDGSSATLRGQQTLIAAGPKILSRIKKYKLTLEGLRQDLDQEAIVLKAKKTKSDQPGEFLDYQDTKETTQLRAEMRQINEAIAGLDVECCDPDVDISQRVLRRVFNNGSFEDGGRLYGGFWQRMKNYERADCLEIDGHAFVELDYGQMSVRLLYGLAGKTPPSGDLYDLSAQGIPTDCRPGIKKLFNAMIWSPTALRRMPKGARQSIPKRYRLAEVTDAIRARHPEVASLLGAGMGPKLLRLESDILVEVLLRLLSQGVVALPIHDAVLVREDQQQQAIAAMKEVFQAKVGVVPEVSVGGG